MLHFSGWHNNLCSSSPYLILNYVLRLTSDLPKIKKNLSLKPPWTLMWSRVSDLHTSVCASVTRPKTLLRQIYFAILQLTLIFFVDGTLDWIMHNTTLLEAVHIDLHRPVVICLLMALIITHSLLYTTNTSFAFKYFSLFCHKWFMYLFYSYGIENDLGK